MKKNKKLLLGATLSLLVFHIWTPPALGETRADPTQLPLASRQLPDWSTYVNTMGIPSALANTDYLDPVTGVRVMKITSPSVPPSNLSMHVDYAEAGPFISREWAPGKHTLLVRDDTGTPWLADYERGVGAINWRQFPSDGPSPKFDVLVASFSNDRLTPRVLFFSDWAYLPFPENVLNDMRLYRFNTEVMFLEGDGSIPFSGREIPDTAVTDQDDLPKIEWLQSSKDDEWFAFQWCVNEGGACEVRKVFAYDRVNDDFYVRSCLAGDFECGSVNEPHLDRDGRYVMIMNGSDLVDPLVECGGTGGFTEYAWERWDPGSSQVTCIEDVYTGHPTWLRGLWVSSDPDPKEYPNFYYLPAVDPNDDQVVVTAHYSDIDAFIPHHHAGQWIQEVADPNQWYFGSNAQGDGAAAFIEWREFSPGSSSYVTFINYAPAYLKPEIGIRAVYQTASGDPGLLDRNLVEVGSPTDLTEGTFHFNNNMTPSIGSDDRLFVWAHDGLNLMQEPESVQFFAPTPVHWGVGVRRANGTDVRLLAHSYGWNPTGIYEKTPWATTSPDGKLVMFQSTMATDGGRTDVFVAEVPLANVGGGGGGGGGCGSNCLPDKEGQGSSAPAGDPNQPDGDPNQPSGGGGPAS